MEKRPKLIDIDLLSYFYNGIKNKLHIHSNKEILDNTTASYTTEEKTKLNGVASGANKYIHPSYTAKENGLYKVTVDSTGHVSSTAAITKEDITGLGIPGSDTTYNEATTSTSGLMSSAMVTKLSGIAENANNYVHPGSGTNPHGTTKSDVGLGNVGNFKAVSTVASQGLTDTEKSNARANIGAGTSVFSGDYNDLSNKPTIPSLSGYATQSWVEGKGYKTTDSNTTYTLTQDSTDGHKITLTPSSGTAMTVTIPDNNTWRGVQNNLTSTATDQSLSANQGKVLNESKMGAVVANSYYGMATPSGATDQWIRTTTQGIIPYQSGGTTGGHQSLGTSTWYFSKSYVQDAYNTVNHIGNCALTYDGTNKCLNFNFS